jgi:hypothetical protein
MIAACFYSSRANKAASRAQPVFATLFAAGATLFCNCGAAGPKIAETSRVDLSAPSALHGVKIDINESALDLNGPRRFWLPIFARLQITLRRSRESQ